MQTTRWLPLALALTALAAKPLADAGDRPPLVRAGEEIVYEVHSSRFGNIGRATLRVDSDTVGNRAAWRLSFDFSARVMLFKVSDRTRSWLDAEQLTTLRYSKTENSPLGGRNEDVRVTGDVATDQPLDELSFIYFVRALDLDPGDSLTVSRHFDPKRNPVRIVAIGPHYYEMRVPDSRQKNGISRLRFLIGEPPARLPLRIESDMPVAGHITMTLVSAN